MLPFRFCRGLPPALLAGLLVAINPGIATAQRPPARRPAAGRPAAPQAVAPRPGLAPLLPAPRVFRFRLPAFLAVAEDTSFGTLIPPVFARASIFRRGAGRDQPWLTNPLVAVRDSALLARTVVGLTATLYAAGRPLGRARVRAVRPRPCGPAPAWCVPAADLEPVQAISGADVPSVAVSPAPSEVAVSEEPNDEDIALSWTPLMRAIRAAAGPLVTIRDEDFAMPTVRVVRSPAGQRFLVAATTAAPAGQAEFEGLVIGEAGDTLIRSPAARARRRPSGSQEELSHVAGMDLDGDSRLDFLLAFTDGSERRYEIISSDALGRWWIVWQGPDRRLPPAAAVPAAPARRRRP